MFRKFAIIVSLPFCFLFSDIRNDFNRAIYKGDEKAFARLLKNKTISNQLSGPENHQSYRIALEGDMDLFLEKMLSSGMNPNLSDSNGYSLLHDACEYGRVRFVQMLLKAGADVNRKTTKGLTPLHSAIRYRLLNDNRVSKSTDVVWELLKAKADVNAIDNMGMTPLIRLIDTDFKDGIDLGNIMLENGADPKITYRDKGLSELIKELNDRNKGNPAAKAMEKLFATNPGMQETLKNDPYFKISEYRFDETTKKIVK
jgi:ankyrin repeat protein